MPMSFTRVSYATQETVKLSSFLNQRAFILPYWSPSHQMQICMQSVTDVFLGLSLSSSNTSVKMFHEDLWLSIEIFGLLGTWTPDCSLSMITQINLREKKNYLFLNFYLKINKSYVYSSKPSNTETIFPPIVLPFYGLVRLSAGTCLIISINQALHINWKLVGWCVSDLVHYTIVCPFMEIVGLLILSA